MYVLREVHERDLDELLGVAAHLDTLNLPADRPQLAGLIRESRRSFGGEIPARDRNYVFVMTSGKKLVGTCMIIGQHGTFERPAIYFKIVEELKAAFGIAK